MGNDYPYRYPRFNSVRQAGVALVIALIFLMILTLLGVAAINNNTLQTHMAYGVGESNVAFESAESALSAGENWLSTQTVPPLQSCSSACAELPYVWSRPATNPPVDVKALFDDTWWLSNGRKSGFVSDDGAAVSYDAAQAFTTDANAPRYVIEYLGVDPGSSLKVGSSTYRTYDYQITARGLGTQGVAGPARTVTQSVYGKGF